MDVRRVLQRIACYLWAIVPVLPVMAADVEADDLIERFAAVETIWSSAASPDGKFVLLGCSHQQLRAACVYELDAMGKAPIILSAPGENRWLRSAEWLDTDWVLLELSRSMEMDGNRGWTAALASNVRTGVTKPWSLPDVASRPANAPGEFIARTPGMVVRGDVNTGKVKYREALHPDTTQLWFDALGERSIELRTDRKQNVFAIRGKDGKPVQLKLGPLPEKSPLAPLFLGPVQGGRRVAAVGYFEGEVQRYQEFDVETGEPVPRDPRIPAENLLYFSKAPRSDDVIGFTYGTGIGRHFFFDETLQKTQLGIAKALSGQTMRLESWSDDMSTFTVSARPPGGGSETHYLFDRKQGSLSPLGAARPQLADLPSLSVATIEYTARDGLEIEASVTLPAGQRAEHGPFPLIVMARAEFAGRDDGGFDWWANFLAQRGYAVLRPNVRGASDRGKAFLSAGFGEFGGAMIDDLIDGARFLVGSGLADRNRICAAGRGYGGYAALMMGLREPGLIRCAVAVNAITDPVTMFGRVLQFTNEQSEAFQYWETYIGTRYNDKAAATAISPARSAQSLRVPVLLLHDTDRLLAKASQSRHLKQEMDLYQRSARLVEYTAADPALLTYKARHTVLTESDAFLKEHLGGGATAGE
ncbi:hypothetical protein GCM10011487_45430 [Steroidobacter agaridevorans]|uniref:Peptidase S9 prolyl oligopeptidase catalytic domain-containing protein n=1 Tax=Steroidobacter agaridevorans TaxID=2695856 RepID=A0A829YI42_9GAMM|nr:hypothetical protein GCM10011487_45430 [Steroidobacter agaridevorans]